MKKYKTTDEFLGDLGQEDKKLFNLLRSYIYESNSFLIENIKWNAPNYEHNGQDRITFNTMNKANKIRIILHKGAKEKEDKKAQPIMDDAAGLITWNSNIRGTLEFDDVEQVRENHQTLVSIFKKWLSL